MPVITFQGKQYECSSEATLLDSLHEQGVALPSGCRGGMCQACMIKAVAGQPPEMAQQGIKPGLKEKNYFLACLCRPDADLEISLPDRRDEFLVTHVTALEQLNGDVMLLRLQKPDSFSYTPGQFVNLMRPADGLSRSYSLASTSDELFLEFHIRIVPGGAFSNWVAEELSCGDEVLLSEVMGNCCYRPAFADQPLLLAGTGTGLAPLYGILRDALSSGHHLPVQLLHGGLSAEGLYYQQQLENITRRFSNFSYTPCVLNGPPPAGGARMPIDRLLAETLREGENWRVYLCGDSDTVQTMCRVCAEQGINESDIHTDAFG